MPRIQLPKPERIPIPQWWDPHDGDPGPDWLGERLTREDLMAITKAQLEFRQVELQAELKYINMMNEVIARYG